MFGESFRIFLLLHLLVAAQVRGTRGAFSSGAGGFFFQKKKKNLKAADVQLTPNRILSPCFVQPLYLSRHLDTRTERGWERDLSRVAGAGWLLQHNGPQLSAAVHLCSCHVQLLGSTTLLSQTFHGKSFP